MKMSNDDKTWKWVRLFMDTSALFKILADDLNEPGTDRLEVYLEIGHQIHTSNLCLGEVLGVLKRKWQRREISEDGYLLTIYRLKHKLDRTRLFIHEILLSQGYDDAFNLVKLHHIDYVDVLSLNYFIQNRDLLDCFVTADRKLWKTGTGLGACCWNIRESAEPPE